MWAGGRPAEKCAVQSVCQCWARPGDKLEPTRSHSSCWNFRGVQSSPAESLAITPGAGHEKVTPAAERWHMIVNTIIARHRLRVPPATVAYSSHGPSHWHSSSRSEKISRLGNRCDRPGFKKKKCLSSSYELLRVYQNLSLEASAKWGVHMYAHSNPSSA
jgi:hypothetical protein